MWNSIARLFLCGAVAGTVTIAALPVLGQDKLADAQAAAEYEKIFPKLKEAYPKSGLAASTQYFEWERFNTTPYVSGTHGKRYVNNFANDIAAPEYGKYENVKQMPVGSVLAKDSFKLTKKGDIKPGPLFLMEKMPIGFNEESRDWRYTLVQPNGKIMGETNGTNSDKVKFCYGCHNAMGANTDGMTFLPKVYRK